MTPTPLAYLAILIWPVVTFLLFSRLRPETAATLTLLGAVLLLPARLMFDFPMIPPLTRMSISCLSAVAALLVFQSGRVMRMRPGTGVELFAVVLVVACVPTALTNSDPLSFGPVNLPGMRPYDGVSLAIDNVLSIWIPFALGRWLYRRPDQLPQLFAILALTMVVYSVGVLYELRMSPQLHRMIYGYHQHSFHQAIRGGGWRPLVFTIHGLALAQFLVLGAVAALALAKTGRRVFGLPAYPVTAYLGILVIAVKSLGALVYAVTTMASIAFLPSRRQLQIMSVLVILVLAYPMARGMDIFPADAFLSAAGSVSEERRGSLAYRFKNEEILLERARERPILGWGSFGRNRVRDEDGRDISVTDGYWIIVFGSQGAIGFLAAFGLMLAPVWIARRSLKYFPSRRERVHLTALAWMVAISGVNLLPNAELNPFILYLSGALLGVSEGARRREPPGPPPSDGRPRERRSRRGEDWSLPADADQESPARSPELVW